MISKKIIFLSHGYNRHHGGAEMSLFELILDVKSKGFTPVAIVPENGDLSDAFEKENIRYYTVNFERWADKNKREFDKKNIATVYHSIETILTNESPFLCVTNTIVVPWLALVAKQYRVPHAWIIREHGDKDHGFQFSVSKDAVLWTIESFSDKIFFNSKALESDFKKMFKRPIPTGVIYPYIRPLARSLPMDHRLLPERASSPIRILCLGRISKGKGQLDIVRAQCLLLNRGIDVELHLVGRFHEQTYIEEIKRVTIENKFEKRVFFHGHQDEPFSLASKCQISVVSSLNEAFGRITVESMYLELPTIATRCGGSVEIIEEGENGLLYEPGNHIELAEKIEFYIKNPSEAKRIAKAGFDSVSKKFSLQRTHHDFFDYIRTLLPKREGIAKQIGKKIINNIPLLKTIAVNYGKSRRHRHNPAVSVIVPNYNHERFLHKRLDSIYGQTYQNFEVILMDDSSTDNSIEVLHEYLEKYPEKTKLEVNEKNSGSAFLQWKKGIFLAKNSLIWIAESDDFCDLDFLEKMLTAFQDSEVALVSSRTLWVDENAIPTGYVYEKYTEKLSKYKWNTNYVNDAKLEVEEALGIKNTIPNVSSVLFRKPENFSLFKNNDWISMKICGDWIFYLYLILGKKIAFICETNNYYRQHGDSVSARDARKCFSFFSERATVARTILSLYHVDKIVIEKNYSEVQLQWEQVWGNEKPDWKLEKAYPIAEILGTRRLFGGFIKIKKTDFFNIAICYPNGEQFAPSETFIQAHIHHLPANVLALHGGRPPILTETKQKITEYLPLNAAYAALLQENQIKAIVAEFGVTGAELLNIAVAAKIPLIVIFHGADATQNEMIDAYKEKYQKLFLSGTVIIAVSRYIKECLHNLGCPLDKIHVIPCGVDTKRFSPSSGRKTIDFLTVGRFVEKKRPDLVIKAFSQVLKLHPQATLTMAGDGPLFNEMKKLAKELEVDTNIVFSGWKSHQEILELMGKSRIFVQHSATAKNGDMEGMPVSIIEAMASGLPVISTRHSGIPDAVIDTETGFLTEEEDFEEMGKKMFYLLENEKNAQKMGEAGRIVVEKKFSMEVTTEKLWRVITDSIVNNKHNT